MPVTIREMTNEEYPYFFRWSIQNQAKDLMEEGTCSMEEALIMAEKELIGILQNTEYRRLMTVKETLSGKSIGFIWMLHEETAGRKQCFLCDFAIWEPYRRKGFGTAALALAEKNALEAECRECVLFVADRNTAARALYEKSGYRVLRQAGYGKYLIKQLA